MKNKVEIIKPRMLEWAIERAGFVVEEYKQKNKDVAKWIDGIDYPTLKKLEAFAKKLYVPFGYLFLEEPPIEEMPIPFFRGDSAMSRMDLNVYDTVLCIQRRQDWLEDYMTEIEADEVSFIGSMDLNDGVNAVVNKLKELLKLEDDWACKLTTQNKAVSKLIDCVENIGVFTAIDGTAGNNTHRPIDINECRGFALIHRLAPYIFVNNADAKSAQLFTVIHEMTHLLLGINAGFGGLDGIESKEDRTESFCDSVAAVFLVPETLLRDFWNKGIDYCAKKLKVSRIVIVRRAAELGLMSNLEIKQFSTQYRIRKNTEKNSGGNSYSIATKRVGKRFGTYLATAVSSGRLSYNEAYKLTGLTGKTFEKYLTKFPLKQLPL